MNMTFSIRLLLLIILCMIFARNAAMGFNRLADKRFDALNPRTKNREIPSGAIEYQQQLQSLSSSMHFSFISTTDL